MLGGMNSGFYGISCRLSLPLPHPPGIPVWNSFQRLLDGPFETLQVWRSSSAWTGPLKMMKAFGKVQGSCFFRNVLALCHNAPCFLDSCFYEGLVFRECGVLTFAVFFPVFRGGWLFAASRQLFFIVIVLAFVLCTVLKLRAEIQS